MKTVGITGGTGFVGKHLTALLVNRGYNVVIFTRSAARKTDDRITYAHWDVERRTCDINPLKDLDAAVSLAGAGIADKRLTKKRKKEIIDSRVQSNEFLADCLQKYSPNCATLVAASAIGYYGADMPGAPAFTEDAPPCADFLGSTCRQWEEAAHKADGLVRTVILRTGIVLGQGGGMYAKLVTPLSLGVMPIPGSGRQVVSWISATDMARLYLHAIENKSLSGAYNGVAPTPVTQSELMHTMSKVRGGLHLPLKIPAFALKLALGELSEELLKSCTVSARKVLDSGFTYESPDLLTALQKIGKGSKKTQE
jgi:uncharacterized protein